eukprot:6071978-Alexandrium_andersonii.AAC.1
MIQPASLDHTFQEGAEASGHLIGGGGVVPAHHEREQARVRAYPVRASETHPARGGEGLGVGHPKGPAGPSPGKR